MIGYLNLILRLAIWFLLTANLSVANIIIGVGVALLLPGRQKAPEALRDWLRVLGAEFSRYLFERKIQVQDHPLKALYPRP